MSKVIVVTKWYPGKSNPVHGIFVMEFVKAKMLYNDVIVLYGELTSDKNSKFPYEIQDNLEDGIRTIRYIYKRRFLKLHRIINLIAGTHCLLKFSREGYKPDIIHFHEYDASLPAFIFAKINHIPLIITEHYSGFVKNSLTFFQKILAKAIFRNADAIFPVSQHLKKSLLNYAPKARFDIVNNVVDTSIFQLTPAIQKDINDKKILLSVARLEQNKGFSYLIKAIDAIRKTRTDFILNIVGDGGLRPELEKMTKELGLNDLIKFHGSLLKPKVAECMSQCDFFVLPSIFETFGCVLIEAMACGKPVVATNIGGPNEIVTQQSGILVESANPEAMKNAIMYMLDNYYKYSADDIVDYVKNRFSLEDIGLKLNGLYDDIITGKSGKK